MHRATPPYPPSEVATVAVSFGKLHQVPTQGGDVY